MPNKVSLYDLIGDMVIYRDLDPVDPRLPRFKDAWAAMGLSTPARPRKQDPAYSQALAWFLRRARTLENPRTELSELIYLGDTALSDANAFRNLRSTGAWRGWAFIGSERDAALSVTVDEGVYVANRWRALAEFVNMVLDEGGALDARTAVLVDIDKTALGARGRNDAAIDRARVTAIETTVAEALGPAFDQVTFRRAYVSLNVPQYHPFTADNQDYLAYVCLMVSAGVSTLGDLVADLAANRLTTFRDFMERVDRERDQLASPALRALHDEILARVREDDPTPFKAFRRREYRETVSRMGCLPDNAPLAQRLVEEICLTREVVELIQWARRRGCLLIAVSDKPDEATIPTPELVAQGYLPLHRAPTHMVGQSIAEMLPNG